MPRVGCGGNSVDAGKKKKNLKKSTAWCLVGRGTAIPCDY